MTGHTWIAEFISTDNLIHYGPEDHLVFHSIVENESGNVLADAHLVFNRYGL